MASLYRHCVIGGISLLISVNFSAEAAGHAKSKVGTMSPEALVKEADEFRFPSGDVRFRVRVVDFKKGKQQRISEYRVLSDGLGRSLVETIKPERQKGRKLLMVMSELWFYSPDIRKPVRVSLQQKLTGEVANGDLANTNFAGDYTATKGAESEEEGKRLLLLKLKAKSKSATYAAIDYWLDMSSGAPVKAHFLSTSGKVMKRGYFEKYASVLGKQRLVQMKVEDAIEKTRVSMLHYSEFSREAISPATFSKESIGR